MTSFPLLALALACGQGGVEPQAPDAAVADSVHILYSSRVDGELEPCG